MTRHCCVCHVPVEQDRVKDNDSSSAVGQQVRTTLRWIVPGVLLAVIPKCPLCFAAYLGIATGLGISHPMASYLRIALIAVCVSSIGYAIVVFLRRRFMRV